MGIGVPLIIVILVILYVFCIMPRRTDFIDSDGKVITAYKNNIFMTIWYTLLGKKYDEVRNYNSNSPIGSDDNSSDFIITNDKDGTHTYEVPDIEATNIEDEEDDLINNIRGRNFRTHGHTLSQTSNAFTANSTLDEFATHNSQDRMYDQLSIVNSNLSNDSDSGGYHGYESGAHRLNVTNY